MSSNLATLRALNKRTPKGANGGLLGLVDALVPVPTELVMGAVDVLSHHSSPADTAVLVRIERAPVLTEFTSLPLGLLLLVVVAALTHAVGPLLQRDVALALTTRAALAAALAAAAASRPVFAAWGERRLLLWARR